MPDFLLTRREAMKGVLAALFSGAEIHFVLCCMCIGLVGCVIIHCKDVPFISALSHSAGTKPVNMPFLSPDSDVMPIQA